MPRNEQATRVGAAIRQARKQRGKVMRNIAEHLQVDVAAVGNWEIGKNLPSTSNLMRTAAYLGIDPEALSRGEVIFKDAPADEPPGDAEIITDLGPPPAGPMDVELLGVAVGGDDGDFSFNGEVVGYVRRPAGIANLRKVFALHVLSDSMVPRYDPGEVIYCGGRDPIPGDHVVIEMFPSEGVKAGKAFVKKLVKRTATQIITRQYNPDEELIFNPYEVKHVWRVIPTRELLGF